MKLNSDKSTGDVKETLEHKAPTVLFKLRVFFLSNMLTLLIETTYLNNQIMFLKCLNNSIYLRHLYVLTLFNS